MREKIKLAGLKMIYTVLFSLLFLTTACGPVADTGTAENLTGIAGEPSAPNQAGIPGDTEDRNNKESVEGQSVSPDSSPDEDTGIPTDSQLQVHYIDVGQGDATLIICDGHAMLIDAGNNDMGTAVQLYLTKQQVTALDYVIGTHPDADHIGGLDVIITKFDCGTIFMTDEEKDTATYRDVIDALDYRGYTAAAPVVGDTYELGSAEFTIVGPAALGTDSNGNSIAVLLKYGNNRFYFEGDADAEEEDSILAAGIDISADVYKIGHHGSKTSTSDAILDAVNPAYAVISVGEGNKYGHPDAEVLNKLRGNNIQVFRTDEQGSVIAVSDGSTLTWSCAPSESWQAGEAVGDSGETDGITEGNQIESNAKSVQESGSRISPDDTDTGDASVTVPENSGEDVTVHITNTGEKYHSAGCRYLSGSDIEISLSDAKARGYTPCSKCNPPQ